MSKATGVRRTHQGRNIGKKAQYLEEVLRLYYVEGLSGLEISQILPLHNSNVYRWLDEYEMQNNGTGRSMKEQVKTGGEAKPSRITGMAAPELSPAITGELQSKNSSISEEYDEVEILKRKIKNLENELQSKNKALKAATLKADLYNEIINVAEKRYNVPIRKKAGTKQ